MKYKLLSVAIILCTILSVTAMLISNKQIVDLNEQILPVGESSKNTTVQQKKEGREINGKEEKNESLREVPTIEQIKEQAKDRAYQEGKEAAALPEEESIIEDSSDIPGLTVHRSETKENKDSMEDVAVFKMNAYDIQDELSLSEKARLIAVIAKISPVDYARIGEYLEDDNPNRGIINVFKLLKIRLSSKDYEKVKDIAAKYIDVKKIEGYIE